MVQAAELKLSSPALEIEAGQQFQVDLLLNTKEESINALEGKIIFSPELLKLKEIRDGNTIVNFWIEKSKNDSVGNVVFSGITPGGFKGENGLVLSIIFETVKSGVVTIEIVDARALLNDGQGSLASLNILPLDIAIPETISLRKPVVVEVGDTLAPESFKPEITRDQNIFDDKYFLVFATQDKGLGMARYEVRELRQNFFSFFTNWKKAVSPYLLTDQELKSYVFIKAVDSAGNEKIEVISPKYSLLWYENCLIYVIIILSLFVYILWKTLLRRRNFSRQKSS